MKLSSFESIAKYESFIIVGIIMLAATSVKLSGLYNFSSDWFWFIAGLALVIEGVISLAKQRKFDRKYKIIERRN